jgi:putative flippase GtrA
MTLTRHARHYTLIGGVQWLVDWGVLVAFTHLGMAVVPANIAGRVAGALLGYWLNGKVTFAGDEHAIGPNQLRRYLMMWVATTAVSTWSLGSIDHWLGLQWAWLAKPAVEAILGVVGFVLSRHWVYRK